MQHGREQIHFLLETTGTSGLKYIHTYFGGRYPRLSTVWYLTRRDTTDLYSLLSASRDHRVSIEWYCRSREPSRKLIASHIVVKAKEETTDSLRSQKNHQVCAETCCWWLLY